MGDRLAPKYAETFRFRNIEAITDKEVEQILVEISAKVVKLLKKQGYLNHEGEIGTIHLVTVFSRPRIPCHGHFIIHCW